MHWSGPNHSAPLIKANWRTPSAPPNSTPSPPQKPYPRPEPKENFHKPSLLYTASPVHWSHSATALCAEMRWDISGRFCRIRCKRSPSLFLVINFAASRFRWVWPQDKRAVRRVSKKRSDCVIENCTYCVKRRRKKKKKKKHVGGGKKRTVFKTRSCIF